MPSRILIPMWWRLRWNLLHFMGTIMKTKSFMHLTFLLLLAVGPLPIRSLYAEEVVADSMPSAFHVSWDEYEATAEKLALHIYDSKWEFDQIVCIARGGMFVGDPLSRLLHKPLAVIFASSYRANAGKQQDALCISKNIAMVSDKLGKRILLVDDLTDSGVTLARIKDVILADGNVSEVRTAVLWHKTSSTCVPDYYAEEVDGALWIYQPFEKYDSIAIQDLREQPAAAL